MGRHSAAGVLAPQRRKGDDQYQTTTENAVLSSFPGEVTNRWQNGDGGLGDSIPSAPKIAEALLFDGNEGFELGSQCARYPKVAPPAALVASFRYLFWIGKTRDNHGPEWGLARVVTGYGSSPGNL